jgi:hypothetical protein
VELPISLNVDFSNACRNRVFLLTDQKGEKMKKSLFVISIIILNFICTFAQTFDNEVKKFELYTGFSYQMNDKTGDYNNDRGFYGLEGSVVFKISRYIGVKADTSGTFRKKDYRTALPDPPLPNPTVPLIPRIFSVKSSIYNFLGGIQFKDNNKAKKFKPFAHVLIGTATITQKLTGDCPNSVQTICGGYNFTRTGFTSAIGGGLDFKTSDRFSIRLFQADYNPIRVNGTTSNNFRIGVGIVFH